MKQRIYYWSCTRLADLLRGTAKPRGETAEGWRDWETGVKVRNPLCFWLAEEFLDKAQDFVNWPMDRLRDLTYWFNNRFVEQTHVCRTGLKRGGSHETGERMLHGLFNELVWFVNEQKSWMEYISHSDKYRHLPSRKTKWPFRHFTNFNYPELGLACLPEDRTDEERAMSKQALDKTNEIEQAYDDEDTVMMKRLIEIRNSLWT